MGVESLIKSKQNQIVHIQKEGVSPHNHPQNQSKVYLLNKVRERLIEKYSIHDVNSVKKFESIRKDAWEMVEEEASQSRLEFYMDSYDKAEILETLIQTMFGYGILDPLIHDPAITEVMVNGIDKIFVEKNGVIEQAKNKRGDNLRFNNNDELLYVIEKIVAPINRKVDESNPIVDARLPNGFRVNVVLNNISLDGTVITIRKFPECPYTMEDLVRFNTMPVYVASFLKNLVEAKYNIIISGGTGSGKTTFLNALSNFICSNARIITIEDAAELKITGINNLIRLETRPPNIEGKGEIIMRELLRSALRMRPDRIIVGEVRGGEALDMLQAMNTGHDGSLSTGHANSALDMLSRLETMVLMAGVDLPLISIRQQIASAVEIIIHLSKLQDGSRKVVQITEVLGANHDGYVTKNLLEFKRTGYKEGELGELKYTGALMERTEKFVFSGINPLNIKELLDLC